MKCNEIINKFNFSNDYTGTDLFHYTSLQGLEGIIQDKELWFTNADFENDVTEGKYTKDLYFKVVEDFKKENGLPADLEKFLSDENLFKIETAYLKDGDNALTGKYEIEIAEFYICCFSTEQDSLPMWRCYGEKRGQGLNIQFNKHILFDENKNTDPDKQPEFVKVIYDEKEQIKLIKEKLLLLLNAWKNGIENFKYAKIAFTQFIRRIKYIFKHPCFAYENEIRYIIKVAKPDYSCVKFRISNDLLIPYIAIPINVDNLTFTISPLANNLTELGIKSFLAKNEVKTPTIKKSKCPVRW